MLFEIDVIEAYYPNSIQTNIHDCGTKAEQYRKQHVEQFTPHFIDLRSKYHVFGMLWTPESIFFISMVNYRKHLLPPKAKYGFMNSGNVMGR